MWASPNVSAYLHVDSTDYIVQYMLHGLTSKSEARERSRPRARQERGHIQERGEGEDASKSEVRMGGVAPCRRGRVKGHRGEEKDQR